MSTPSPESSTRVSTDARAAMNAVLSELVVAPVQVAVRESAAGLATAGAVSDLRTRLEEVKRTLNAELKSPDSDLQLRIAHIAQFLDVESDDLKSRLAANCADTAAAVAETRATALRESEGRVGSEIRRAVSDVQAGVHEHALLTQAHVSDRVGNLRAEIGDVVVGARDQILTELAGRADVTVGRIDAAARETVGQLQQGLRGLNDSLGKAASEVRDRDLRAEEAANERHEATNASAAAAVGGAKQAVLDELGRAVAAMNEAVPRETGRVLAADLREMHEALARLETGLTAMTAFAEQQRAWNEGTGGEVKALRLGIGGHELLLTEVAGALRSRLNATLGGLALLAAGGAGVVWLLLR